jgi:hypothetical protein
MSKTISLALTEKEYKQLLQGYLLGYLIEDAVTQKTPAQMMAEAELLNKYCRAGYEAKVKGFVELKKGFYSFPKSMEEDMLSIQEEYVEYVESGDRADELEAITKQIDQMRKDGLL